MTDRLDTWLAAQRMHDEFHGYTAAEIEAMPMDVYHKLRARAGLAPVDPFSDAYAAYDAPPQADTVPAPEAVQANADAVQGLDPNSDAYFLAWRSQRTRGGEGVGIFGGSTAQSKTAFGRSQYSRANVVEPPRLEGRYVRHDDQRDTRSAAQRFGTPGNAFGI